MKVNKTNREIGDQKRKQNLGKTRDKIVDKLCIKKNESSANE